VGVRMETKNAVIESTMLGYESHGLLTFMLHLDYGGSGQGAGGYRLDRYDKEKQKTLGTAIGLGAIAEVLKVVGVDKWEDLQGSHIRAKCSHSKVYAIGHLLEDKWLNFEEFFSGDNNE
jgi:hypothetical protein